METSTKAQLPRDLVGRLEIVKKPHFVPDITVASAVRQYLMDLGYRPAPEDIERGITFDIQVQNGSQILFEKLKRAELVDYKPLGPWMLSQTNMMVGVKGGNDIVALYNIGPIDPIHIGYLRSHIRELSHYLKTAGIETRLLYESLPGGQDNLMKRFAHR